VSKDLQLYVGVAGESISFPNKAAAEIDFYAGIRPTFGSVALDFGVWYYWYPGGECFHNLAIFGIDCALKGALPVNLNVVKRDLSFWEVYARATFTVNDQFAFGGAVYYSPSVLNAGAEGTYVSANVKFTAPNNTLPNGFGLYVSGEVGHWFLGTSDPFYCTQNAAGTACGGLFPNGVPYTSYTTWNIGFGITKSVFTLDFRYSDTNLNKGDCNALTSDHTAREIGNVTPTNPRGFESNWCGQAYYVTGKFDLTALTNLK
jgi:Bacterial protein of unknown function (Gcw_chp)